MSDSKFYNSTNHIFYTDNGIDTYITSGSGQNLHITCDTLTADTINGTSGLIADKIEVSTDSNNLGLNQLSNEQLLSQNTSGVYELQGTSVCIMDSSQNPVRIACGGPKVNFDNSSNGGVLTYSSTAGANFTGPVAYQSNTFCEDYTGLYVDISEDGTWFCCSLTNSPVGSPPSVNIYKWGISNYSFNRNIANFSKAKVSGNYIALSNFGPSISIYFYNGSSWNLQQTIGSLSTVTYFDIIGSQLYVISANFLKVYSRTDTTWTQIASVDLQYGIGQDATGLSVNNDGTVITVVRDYYYVDIYESLAKVATFTTLDFVGSCVVTPDGTKIFYADTNTITILAKVSNVWTEMVNKTACINISNMCCNNNRLVCGRSEDDVYGRINVFNISDYTNELVIADTVYADEDFNLIVKSNYRDVNIQGSNVYINTDNIGATYVNGNMDILGDLDVGGSLSFNQLIAGIGDVGNVSYGFENDGDSGMYSTGDGNVNWALNGVEKMSLTSSGLTVPKLISSNGAFTLNTYVTTGAFALVNTDWTNLKLTDDVIIQNTALVKSSYGRVGTNAGHRFTNSSSEAMVLMVTANILIQGSMRSDHQIRIQDDPIYYCQVMSPTQSTGYGFSYSSVLYIPAGKYFELLVFPESATQIYVGASSGINLQVFRLS